MPRRSALAVLSCGAYLLPALALLTFLAGCAQPAAKRSNRVPVTVAKAERRALPWTILASGTVEPVQTADVGSQVGGVVTRLDFHEGDDVRAGQALIQLDARPFRAALAQAEGQLGRDRAQEHAARLAADRAASLFEKDLISRQEWDAAKATADGLLAMLQSDSAGVGTTRLNLEFATIRAPFAGRTGRLNVRVGDYVKAATSEPLVTVNQVMPIRVTFTVSESDRAAVQRAQRGHPEVVVRVSPTDSLEVRGRLAFVDNAVDPTTGTLTLKGEFPNTDGHLWPGAFVEVRLVLGVQQDALVVPATAITNGQQGTYVYVLNADSTATSKQVVVDRADDVTAVIASGLEPGETVVTDGQFRISPGAHLVVRDPAAAKAGAGHGQHGGAAKGGAEKRAKS